VSSFLKISPTKFRIYYSPISVTCPASFIFLFENSKVAFYYHHCHHHHHYHS
jgi:hypothetical protein